jgi:hypothetical protein
MAGHPVSGCVLFSSLAQGSANVLQTHMCLKDGARQKPRFCPASLNHPRMDGSELKKDLVMNHGVEQI